MQPRCSRDAAEVQPRYSRDVVDRLPGTLRDQLRLCENRNLFLKVPFFKNCDMSQITVIVPRIHREYAWPGKTILHEGVEGRGLFMIGRGFVKITVQGQLKELLAQPDFFGEQVLCAFPPGLRAFPPGLRAFPPAPSRLTHPSLPLARRR